MNNPSEEVTTETVKLVAKYGCLATPREAIKSEVDRALYDENPILVVQHKSGEHDTIRWPRPNAKHLRAALYDAREMGLIPDVSEVTLPNGKMFTI
jgi:hypothetical protein